MTRLRMWECKARSWVPTVPAVGDTLRTIGERVMGHLQVPRSVDLHTLEPGPMNGPAVQIEQSAMLDSKHSRVRAAVSTTRSNLAHPGVFGD
jgi:hypothetical protein